MTWTFNPNQLASWPDAQTLAKTLEEFRQSSGLKLGGGVMPVTSNWETSGIYVPHWEGGPAGFPVPNDAGNNKFWLHFRFFNGRSGVNVGLILDGLQRHGGNQWYVFYTLNANDLS